MADITYARIGTTVKGAAAMLRPQAAVAWKHLVAVVKADMGVDLDSRIIQARGGAVASAGTHIDGACVDVRVWGLTKAQRRRIVLLARECGFPASWDRAWSGNEHLHLGADIPGVWTRASYQVAAVKSGFNGLGSGGRGGRDDGPKPSAWRNTATGPEWARQRLAASGVASPGVPSTGDKPATSTPTGGLNMSDANAILDRLNDPNRGLPYLSEQIKVTDATSKQRDAGMAAQIKAVGDLVGGRDAINQRNADTAAIVERVVTKALQQVPGVDQEVLAKVVHDAAVEAVKETKSTVDVEAVLDGIAKRMEA